MACKCLCDNVDPIMIYFGCPSFRLKPTDSFLFWITQMSLTLLSLKNLTACANVKCSYAFVKIGVCLNFILQPANNYCSKLTLHRTLKYLYPEYYIPFYVQCWRDSILLLGFFFLRDFFQTKEHFMHSNLAGPY